MTTVPENESEVVLVVDDEQAIQMVLVETLIDEGFRTLQASDGESALTWIDSGTRIDLLITDMGLPGSLNGRQLADAARKTRPNLKVIFISGYGEEKIMGHGPLKPGESILVKPFTGSRLVVLIDAILSDRRAASDAEYDRADAQLGSSE